MSPSNDMKVRVMVKMVDVMSLRRVYVTFSSVGLVIVDLKN